MSTLEIQECVIVRRDYRHESGCKHSGIFVAFLAGASNSEEASKTGDEVSKGVVKMLK